MAGRDIENRFFKIREIPGRTHIARLLAEHRVLVTYNQIMQSSTKMACILLFSHTDVEVPSLVTYSHHFGIELLKICSADVAEIQGVIRHARMVGIPCGSALKSILDTEIARTGTNDVSIDLARISLA